MEKICQNCDHIKVFKEFILTCKISRTSVELINTCGMFQNKINEIKQGECKGCEFKKLYGKCSENCYKKTTL